MWDGQSQMLDDQEIHGPIWAWCIKMKQITTLLLAIPLILIL